MYISEKAQGVSLSYINGLTCLTVLLAITGRCIQCYRYRRLAAKHPDVFLQSSSYRKTVYIPHKQMVYLQCELSCESLDVELEKITLNILYKAMAFLQNEFSN